MVVTEGDPANPTTLLTGQQSGAAITSSYCKEKTAMHMALEWILPLHAPRQQVTSKKWGWRKDQPLKVYQALNHSVINYVAPAWEPYLSPSRLD